MIHEIIIENDVAKTFNTLSAYCRKGKIDYMRTERQKEFETVSLLGTTCLIH